MKIKSITLTEDQKTELENFVIANGYQIKKTPGIDGKHFSLIADTDILTGVMKVALCSEEQFDIIQKAICEAKKLDK